MFKWQNVPKICQRTQLNTEVLFISSQTQPFSTVSCQKISCRYKYLPKASPVIEKAKFKIHFFLDCQPYLMSLYEAHPLSLPLVKTNCIMSDFLKITERSLETTPKNKRNNLISVMTTPQGDCAHRIWNRDTVTGVKSPITAPKQKQSLPTNNAPLCIYLPILLQ